MTRNGLFVVSLCAALVVLVPLVALAAEWAPNVAYSVGNLVTYQGPTYKCLQSHTSIVTWEPPNAPSLWELQSGTPAPTPRSTATPRATATPTTPPGSSSVEAESGMISGATRTASCSACSGGMKVGFVGNGSANFVTLSVNASSSGTYTMRIYYLVSGTRNLSVSVNGGSGPTLSLSGTSFSTVASATTNVSLNMGVNTVKLYNNTAYGPDVDRITLTGGGSSTPTPTATPRPTATPTTPPAGGGFPAKTFAPYVETWANINPASVASSTGHKYYTLAFIISNGCNAYWNGDTPMSANFYSSFISQLRGMGGDVIVSFGGASGIELGQACSSVSSLQAAYQSAISKYGLKWIDLDIEGASIADTASVDRRNQAIKNLQSANSGLRVSYTLPVMPEGLTQDGLNLLSNAKSRGVRVDVVNVMAMDYGGCNIDMGQAAIQAAQATRSQLSTIGVSAKIGVTPMIYANDVGCENFSTQDASELTSFANANGSWIGELAFWAVGRDPGYSQLNIFKAFR